MCGEEERRVVLSLPPLLTDPSLSFRRWLLPCPTAHLDGTAAAGLLCRPDQTAWRFGTAYVTTGGECAVLSFRGAQALRATLSLCCFASVLCRAR